MANITTPLPGVFYRSPSPEEAAFVNEGDQIEVGQVVGLIEVMKNFTELKSEVAGTLTRFLVENDEDVSVGQEIAVVD